MNPLKEMIAGAVDRLGDELERLSHSIHDHPELGYQEVKAAAWLTEFLDAQGFKVEGGGGKVRLIKGGVFKDVDAAMMVHGWDRWIPHMDLLGIVRVGLEFTGKAAHASADPWEGVNALDAAVQTYTNVAMLRQQVRP